MRMQVARLLYGDPGGGDYRRQSKRLAGNPLGGAEITWIETLNIPVGPSRDDALMAIHLDLGDAVDGTQLASATAFLGNLRDVPGGVRQSIQNLLSEELPGAVISDRRVGYVVTHWVPESFEESPIEGLSGAIGWARAIAAANPAYATSKTLQRPEGEFEEELSGSWLVSVLHAGAAFVGTSGRLDDFHSMAEVLVHSVYLDSVLLELCQENGVDYLAAQVAELWDSGSSLNAISRLEREALRFRSSIWWTEISGTSHINRLLQRMQAQRDLPQRETRLRADVDDMVAYASTRRADRTNMLLTLFVIAGFGVGGAALVAQPGAKAVALALGLAIAAWLVMQLVLRRKQRW